MSVPYDELLGLFGFGSLELRRRVASLMFLYKLVRGVVDDPASLAVLSYRVPSFNSRSNLLFAVPFCRTTAHASSPLYRHVVDSKHDLRMALEGLLLPEWSLERGLEQITQDAGVADVPSLILRVLG
ncbi:hypothetical protein J6590_029119 [Homalodisca vitripennis]|nr:hypothetical protein J6590_029119 [Homalodisca vitripennis]